MGLEQTQNAKITVKVGDKAYKMRRVSRNDLAAIKQALHDKMVDEAMLRRPALVAGGVYGEVMVEALRYQPTDQDMWNQINSLAGQADLLAKCMDITPDELATMTDENGGIRWLADMSERLLVESGLWMPQEDGKSAGRPSAPQSTGKETPATFSTPSPDTPSNP